MRETESEDRDKKENGYPAAARPQRLGIEAGVSTRSGCRDGRAQSGDDEVLVCGLRKIADSISLDFATPTEQYHPMPPNKEHRSKKRRLCHALTGLLLGTLIGVTFVGADSAEAPSESTTEVLRAPIVEEILPADNNKVLQGTWLVQVWVQWTKTDRPRPRKDLTTSVHSYAPWCPFSKRFQSIWNETIHAMEREAVAESSKTNQSRLHFARVSAVDNAQLAAILETKAYPTLKFLRNGDAWTFSNATLDLESVLDFAKQGWARQPFYNRLPSRPAWGYVWQIQFWNWIGVTRAEVENSPPTLFTLSLLMFLLPILSTGILAGFRRVADGCAGIGWLLLEVVGFAVFDDFPEDEELEQEEGAEQGAFGDMQPGARVEPEGDIAERVEHDDEDEEQEESDWETESGSTSDAFNGGDRAPEERLRRRFVQRRMEESND